MPPPYGAPPAVPPALQKKVDLWFILSIVSIFCGCGLLAIVPILIANGAKEALRRGDFAKAESDIKTAKILVILGFVGVSLLVLAYIAYVVFVLGLSAFLVLVGLAAS
jgi:hypothetical protein